MLSKSSAPVTKENLMNYYDALQEELEKDGSFQIFDDPRRIFACDEQEWL